MMLKTAFSPKHRKFVTKIHKNLSKLSLPLKGMEQMGIPLHAGAVKYFMEQGESIPESEVSAWLESWGTDDELSPPGS